MLAPGQTEVDNIYEVRFKNTRKGFFRNVNGLRLYIGDHVVVESDRGYDVGTLSLGGVSAELQMKKKGYKKALRDIPRIYRKANEKDLELLEQVRGREKETLVRGREIITLLNLDMKLSEVEYQGDNAKAIFYYIADHRVDFRELIKLLAREFRIRVEMKQIGLRHEAGLVGGIGSCGRELCCSTWLTEFKTVSTSAARYQNLSLNPMKISGLCGRLKCCLNYELESYLDALEDFPQVEKIDTAKGRALLQKTDIFKRRMWFSYINESTWHPLDVDEVKRIAELNAKGEKPDIKLAGAAAAAIQDDDDPSPDTPLDFVDVVGTELPPKEDSRSRRRRGGNKDKSRRRSGGKGGNQRPRNKPNAKGGQSDQSGKGSGGQEGSPKNQGQGSDSNQRSNSGSRNRKPKGRGRGGRNRGGNRNSGGGNNRKGGNRGGSNNNSNSDNKS